MAQFFLAGFSCYFFWVWVFLFISLSYQVEEWLQSQPPRSLGPPLRQRSAIRRSCCFTGFLQGRGDSEGFGCLGISRFSGLLSSLRNSNEKSGTLWWGTRRVVQPDEGLVSWCVGFGSVLWFNPFRSLIFLRNRMALEQVQYQQLIQRWCSLASMRSWNAQKYAEESACSTPKDTCNLLLEAPTGLLAGPDA